MSGVVARLTELGQVARVSREVDPRHEISAVTKKVQGGTNRALLFERVRGSPYPVLTNAFSSQERVADLLGVGAGELMEYWVSAESRLSEYAPVRATSLDRQPVSLGSIPFLVHHERDAGPYVTGGVIIAHDPDSGVPNLSFHRIQVTPDGRWRVRITPGHHLGIYLEKAEAREEPLPAAILVGNSPGIMLAGASRLPLGVSELYFAGALEGAPIEICRGAFVPVDVPVATDFIIEGRFLPGVREREGPFGEFMGYYCPVVEGPVFEVTGATARMDAIYYGLNSGSREEITLLSLAASANVYKALKTQFPGVLDVACWPFVYHCVIKIRQEFPGQARQVLLAALGSEVTWVKVCVVVDEDVNIRDPADVTWAICTRCAPERDVLVLPGIPSFRRDPYSMHWGRVAIDATKPLHAAEEFERTRIPGEDTIDLAEYGLA